MHAFRGTICAEAVTPGRANDSPYLRAMPDITPRGSDDAPVDAQYGVIENRQAVLDGKCRPVIEPGTDYKIKGDAPGRRC